MKPDEFEQILAALQLELRPAEIARHLGISRPYCYRLRAGGTRRLTHDVVVRAERLQRSLTPAAAPNVGIVKKG
ncbi:MAG TPA: hypothetical protein VKB16_01785 [Beijerinckiaceae bacterium]|jgi:hypothetical protein|nr:hypothetical protein [Beijerinckiaceae bacterium]